MAAAGLPLPDGPDPEGLLEFSVVYTDRALNHMSKKFQGVMKSLNNTFKEVYNANQIALVPGGGSYAMEAAARQFTTKDSKVLVIRNGWFSYRWTQIFDEAWPNYVGLELCKARPCADEPEIKAFFEPTPIAEVVARIAELKPDVVFAPHVETSAGMILPPDYIAQIGQAVRDNGGLFVLDGIAAGCIWVDLKEQNVDVYLTAPQKGWSGPAGCGVVVMGERAAEMLKREDCKSDSFVLNLKTWANIMKAYEDGGHGYHATMPTDALCKAEEVTQEMRGLGFPKLKQLQQELGDRVRALLEERGLKSLAAPGFGAPGVVVVYTEDGAIGGKFAKAGMQIAAGVPLMCEHNSNSQSDKFRTFRLGLFGLDKLTNIDRALENLSKALDVALA